jgi:hypothetical protein
MLTRTLHRFAILVAGTALGGWLSVHMQFGISGFWGLASDELEIVALILLFALALVLVFFRPLSWLVERFAPPDAINVSVLVVSVGGSLLFGVWFYAFFLGHRLNIVFGRDLPFVLCFALLGVGYALAFHAQRRI